MVYFLKSFRPIILDRGENLYYNDAVYNVKRDGNIYRANVSGTYIYDVSVEIENDQFVGGECSCPYDGNCKHMAALLYAIDDDCEFVMDNRSIEIDELLNLDIDTLKSLLRDEALKNDSLYRMLKLKHLYEHGSLNERIDFILSNSFLWDEYKEEDKASSELTLILEEINSISSIDKRYTTLKYLLDNFIITLENSQWQFMDEILKAILNSIMEIYNLTKDIKYIEYILDIRDKIVSYEVEDIDAVLLDNFDAKIKNLLLKRKIIRKLSSKILNEIYSDDPDGEMKKIAYLKISESFVDKRALLDIYEKNNMLDEYINLVDEMGLVYSFNEKVEYMKYKYYKDKDKSLALESIRKLVVSHFKMEYFIDAVEISDYKTECNYLFENKHYKELMEIYDNNNDYVNLMNVVASANDIEYYDEYQNILAFSFKDEYIYFYYSYIINSIKSNTNRFQYKKINDRLGFLLYLEPDMSLIYRISHLVYDEYPKRKALHEELTVLAPFKSNN